MENGSGNGTSESPAPSSSSGPWQAVAELGSAAITAAGYLLLAKWGLITGMEAAIALGGTAATVSPVSAARRLLTAMKK